MADITLNYFGDGFFALNWKDGEEELALALDPDLDALPEERPGFDFVVLSNGKESAFLDALDLVEHSHAVLLAQRPRS